MTLVSPENPAATARQRPDVRPRGERERERPLPTTPPRPRVRATGDLQVGLKGGGTAVGTSVTFSGLSHGGEHVALGFGGPPAEGGRVPLVGVHSECLSGQVLGALHCDCAARLQQTIRTVHDAGGVLLYLRQTGRDFGAVGTLDSCARRRSSVAGAQYRAERENGSRVVAEMLTALGLSRIALLTCHPDWAAPVARYGIAVERVTAATAAERPAEAPARQPAASAVDGFVTPREHEVLRRVALGQSNPEIASAMYISRNTVKSYLQNVLQKLNARNRVEAIARARELGIPL
ncbi:LuxR C-terminal-related transcriptional regulator [Streptomyces catenulae]|uniref:LuxR C-terminal-related transcriptional regulator n=1 Tax=Streptomyces catenulae TaxID=66875 RepID=A0ABV2Z650_9ACTN|nr:LuxR C-terminal-related transcriptional regulator [Streptomyces catenulae]